MLPCLAPGHNHSFLTTRFNRICASGKRELANQGVLSGERYA